MRCIGSKVLLRTKLQTNDHDVLWYLCTQRVDNARIAENHQRRRQKETDKNYAYGYSHKTAEECVWYTDSIDDVGGDACHHRTESWEDNPDRDHD